MESHDDLMNIEALACAAVRHAYPDTPAVGTLMFDSAIEYHQWQQAVAADRRTPGIVDPDRLRQHHYTYLLFRAVALDIIALQAQSDIHSAAQCAEGANRMRQLDGLGTTTQETARTWLRATYRQWLIEGPHPWDCPGNCGGTGIVMRYWHEDGVPVHQEPDGCDRGISEDPDPAASYGVGADHGIDDGEIHPDLVSGGLDHAVDPWF